MKNRKTPLKNKYITTILLLMIIMQLTACGAPDGSGSGEAGSNAPAVVSCQAEGGCTGGENDQYINVSIKFDKNVSIKSAEKAAEDLRIVIGGERINSKNITVSQNESPSDEINIKISINKVTNGVLEITPADGKSLKNITDESGKNQISSLNIKKLIPSGVTLETAGNSESGEYPAWTAANVMSVPTHRSMVWIQLFADGELVEPDDTSQPDVMDGAAGIHEHEFLWADQESVAQDIADAVNNFYGERFEAKSSGSTVTVTEKSGGSQAAGGGAGAGMIELKIYEY